MCMLPLQFILLPHAHDYFDFCVLNDKTEKRAHRTYSAALLQIANNSAKTFKYASMMKILDKLFAYLNFFS